VRFSIDCVERFFHADRFAVIILPALPAVSAFAQRLRHAKTFKPLLSRTEKFRKLLIPYWPTVANQTLAYVHGSVFVPQLIVIDLTRISYVAVSNKAFGLAVARR